jgi:hypothetical protein
MLQELARNCRVRVEFAVMREVKAFPRLEPRPRGVQFVIDTLEVESPWVFTHLADSNLDRMVRFCWCYALGSAVLVLLRWWRLWLWLWLWLWSWLWSWLWLCLWLWLWLWS